MPDLLDLLLGAGAHWVYAAIALLVLAESALFIGFVLPGEASVLLGGMLASVGRLDLAVLVPLVVAAAVVGDATGFWVGRRFGPWLCRRRTMVRHEARVERLRGFVRRRGGVAILTGRMTALLRAMTPPVAGMSGVGWRTFLAYDVVGGVVWAGGVALLGYAAGQSYQRVADVIGQVGAIGAGLAAVAGVAWWWRARTWRGGPATGR